jgi:hypothetical protein
MIKAIRNFLLDQYLGVFTHGTMVEMQNLLVREGPHRLKCKLRPDVESWIDDDMEGRCYIEHKDLDVNPNILVESVFLKIWFSRPEDAVRFRLTFAS